ncbi:MAG: HPF/RaiA family ribosome-associated protein [Planctomycetota bacterium]
MKIQVNFGDIDTSHALTEHVEDRVLNAFRHVEERVTRIEVHLRDDNAHKHGADDRRCTIEARIAGQQPLAVEATGEDLYAVIAQAADKAGRAVSHRLERLDAR